jgi:radical SAM protein with 4Fe4S-binding SPASM domain
MKQIVQNMVKHLSLASIDLQRPTPTTTNIELTNACDLRCTMCRRGKRPEGFIDVGLVAGFVPEARALGVKQAGLHTVGESILHPDMGEVIRICKVHGLYTYIDVNGNSLNEEKAAVLVDSGLDSIKFSIDAADDELYAAIRRGGNFSRVYENLATLRRIRDAQKSPMRIYSLFIIMQENQHQRELFKEKMQGLVDEIQYTVVVRSTANMSMPHYLKSKISQFDVPNESGICTNLFNRIVLAWTGDVTLCCTDFDLDLKIGTFRKGNLRSLWEGERATAFRRAVIEKRTRDLPAVCHGCDLLRYDMVERTRRINELME